MAEGHRPCPALDFAFSGCERGARAGGKEITVDAGGLGAGAGAGGRERGRALMEERKVVSILCVDLVGFVARSDQADPEDIRSTLRPYYACVRQELVRWGGTVEKVIGDAVMAAFGAPVGHEDDAERAVRAALRIVEAVQELNA